MRVGAPGPAALQSQQRPERLDAKPGIGQGVMRMLTVIRYGTETRAQNRLATLLANRESARNEHKFFVQNYKECEAEVKTLTALYQASSKLYCDVVDGALPNRAAQAHPEPRRSLDLDRPLEVSGAAKQLGITDLPALVAFTIRHNQIEAQNKKALEAAHHRLDHATKELDRTTRVLAKTTTKCETLARKLGQI